MADELTKELFDKLSNDDESYKIQQLLDAYAKSISTYYAAEKEFCSLPTQKNLHLYHIAVDRLNVLHSELSHANKFGDAVDAREPAFLYESA